MKKTKRFLALLLSVTVIAGCLMALPVSADTTFMNYGTLEQFNDAALANNLVLSDETKDIKGVLEGVYYTADTVQYNYTGDGLKLMNNTKNKRFMLQMDLDLKNDGVYSYVMKAAGKYQLYAPNFATSASGRSYVQSDGTLTTGLGSSSMVLNTSTYASLRGPYYYDVVVDAETKTCSWYMDGVWKYDATYTSDTASVMHGFQITADNTDWSKYYEMDYLAYYPLSTTPAFQIVGTPTATQAVIQFNTPVAESSLTGITVGGKTATAVHVSATYDEPNVYQLTYDALEDDANYEIAVTGATDLPDSAGTATALTLQNQSFTLGTPKDPNEMIVYVLEGFDEEPLAEDVEFVNDSDNNPMGWNVIRHLGIEDWNYSGDGRLLLKAPYKNNQNKRTQFNFNIDLTKNMIYDYRVTSPVWGCYVIDKDEDTGGPYVGNTTDASPNAEASSVNSSTTVTNGGSTGGVTNRYTIMVDTEGKTVKYYLNGILKATDTFEESETQKVYNHHFVNTKTGENEHQYSLYYYAEYEAAENANIEVLDVPDGKSVVVQFNQPVALASLTEGLTIADEEGASVGGTITAADVSSEYERPNTYMLSFDTLPVGTYTVAANVKGLSDSADSTNFGSADFEIVPFSVEVKTLNGENYIQSNRALKLSGEDGEDVSTAEYSYSSGGDTYTVGLVKLPEEIYGENAYQVNSRNMNENVTWYILVTPVAEDGSTLEAVSYTLTYATDKLSFADLTIDAGTATVSVTNNRTGTVGFAFILAEYYTDANGKVTMTQAVMDDSVNVGAFGTNVEKTLSLTPTEGEGYSYKAFFWNNVTTGLIPFVD